MISQAMANESTKCDRRFTQISAREAMAHIPRLEDFCDAGEGPSFLMNLRKQPPETYGNVLAVGAPGSGKTRLMESFLRDVFQNPTFCNGDIEDASQDDELYRSRGIKVERSAYDIRFWQTHIPGRIYAFVRIDGASDHVKTIESKVSDILYHDSSHHTFVLVDEAGELYYRGLEECLRPVLTAENISTFATAQNFHSKKRKSDSIDEDNARRSAFLRRFPKMIEMQGPSDANHLRFLAHRVREWVLTVDDISTIRLLVQKAVGIVGHSLRLLIQAIDAPDRRLTREMVLRDDVNVTGT